MVCGVESYVIDSVRYLEIKLFSNANQSRIPDSDSYH